MPRMGKVKKQKTITRTRRLPGKPAKFSSVGLKGFGRKKGIKQAVKAHDTKSMRKLGFRNF